jgi:hypothetical protein
MKSSRPGLRRAVWPAASVVAVALSAGACAAVPVNGVELVRSPGSSHPTGTVSGYLIVEDGCLRVRDERGAEKSLIFADHLDVVVDNDALIVDGVTVGMVGSTGVRVTLTGRDGPVSYLDSEVTGPTDRAGNQTDPWEVTGIRLRPS